MNMQLPQQYTGPPMPPTPMSPTPQSVPPPPPYIAHPSCTLMSPFQTPMAPVRSAQPSAFATLKNGPRPRHVQQTPYGYPYPYPYANVQQPLLPNQTNPSPRLAQAWHIRKLRIARQQSAKMKMERLKRQLKDMTREYIEACEAYTHALESVGAAHDLIAWTEQAEHRDQGGTA